MPALGRSCPLWLPGAGTAHPAACRRLSDNSITAGLRGRLQPAQQGLIKSEIPAVFSWALAWDATGRESVKGNKDN